MLSSAYIQQPTGHDLGNFQSFVLEQSGCAGKRWDMKFLGTKLTEITLCKELAGAGAFELGLEEGVQIRGGIPGVDNQRQGEVK